MFPQQFGRPMQPQQYQPQQAGYTSYYPQQGFDISSIMPLIMIMMVMAMIMPMMKGITAQT